MVRCITPDNVAAMAEDRLVQAERHEETPTGRYRTSPPFGEAIAAEEHLRDL